MEDKIYTNKIELLRALRGNGMILEHASEELKNDEQVVSYAVQESLGRAFKFASEDLKRYSKFVLSLIKSYDSVLVNASE